MNHAHPQQIKKKWTSVIFKTNTTYIAAQIIIETYLALNILIIKSRISLLE